MQKNNSKLNSKILIISQLRSKFSEKNNSHILFLNEGCRLYKTNKEYKYELYKNISVLNYKINSIDKNFSYLLEIYESLLETLSIKLNKIHNLSYSVQSWRIIIGPWLFEFISIIFYNWKALEYINNNYSIKHVEIAKSKKVSTNFRDYKDFVCSSTTDEFNNIIYTDLLKYFKNIKIKYFFINKKKNKKIKNKFLDYIIKFFESKNVTHIFTVSGGGCIHLIDSLRKSEKIKTVCVHHEQSATMAAEGYTRLKKIIGVSIVTAGPGGINALNGVFGCWTDSIPSFIISGQVSLNQSIRDTNVRQFGDQEYPIIDSAKTMTKYAVMIDDKNTIKYHLEKAYYEATSGRPGPVWIDVPLDIQGSIINENDLIGYVPNEDKTLVDDQTINEIVSLLCQSKKPLIIVGNGIKVSNSESKLLQLLSKTGIPVMTNCHSAIDTVNESYEYYSGRYGILGQRSSNKIIQECDFLLCLGSRLILKTTGYNVNEFAKNAKKVIVDIDINEIKKHKFKIDYSINNDVNAVLDQLLTKTINVSISDWQTYCKKLRSEDSFVFKKHYELKDITSIYVFIEKLCLIY